MSLDFQILLKSPVPWPYQLDPPLRVALLSPRTHLDKFSNGLKIGFGLEQARNQGQTFSPLEKCFGRILKLLDIVQKILVTHKTPRPQRQIFGVGRSQGPPPPCSCAQPYVRQMRATYWYFYQGKFFVDAIGSISLAY